MAGGLTSSTPVSSFDFLMMLVYMVKYGWRFGILKQGMRKEIKW